MIIKTILKTTTSTIICSAVGVERSRRYPSKIFFSNLKSISPSALSASLASRMSASPP